MVHPQGLFVFSAFIIGHGHGVQDEAASLAVGARSLAQRRGHQGLGGAFQEAAGKGGQCLRRGEGSAAARRASGPPARAAAINRASSPKYPNWFLQGPESTDRHNRPQRGFAFGDSSDDGFSPRRLAGEPLPVPAAGTAGGAAASAGGGEWPSALPPGLLRLPEGGGSGSGGGLGRGGLARRRCLARLGRLRVLHSLAKRRRGNRSLAVGSICRRMSRTAGEYGLAVNSGPELVQQRAEFDPLGLGHRPLQPQHNAGGRVLVGHQVEDAQDAHGAGVNGDLVAAEGRLEDVSDDEPGGAVQFFQPFHRGAEVFLPRVFQVEEE